MTRLPAMKSTWGTCNQQECCSPRPSDPIERERSSKRWIFHPCRKDILLSTNMTFPGKTVVQIIFDDQPFFAEDTVNYIGEPILLVVGADKQRILETYCGYSSGISSTSSRFLHWRMLKTISYNQFLAIPITLPNIVFPGAILSQYFCGRSRLLKLNTLPVIRNIFTWNHKGYWLSYENGKISVYGSIQCPYYVKNALMTAFGWENDRIRIVPTTLGGAFGGKEDYPSLIAGQAAFAAFKTGRPVQLVFDRTEDIEVTPKRHPSVIKLKTTLDENNQIIALEADISLNAGAYSGLSNVVLQRTMFNIAGVYQIPSLKVKGRAVATNTVPSGAFRGFGAPQAIFAIEMHLNLIAEKLNLDPLDFKLKHLVKIGDSTTTGGTFRQDIKLPELIATVDRMSGYRRKVGEFARQKDHGLKGIGLSLFLHGCGFTGSGERDHIKATVKLRKLIDNRVEILVANVDMGQGLRTTLKKIVAKVLDLQMTEIVYENPDTDRVPDSGPTVASRTVMIVGKLLEEAAMKLKSRWNELGEIEVTQKYLHPTDIVWDDAKFAGDAYPAYSWGVNAVEVEVDPLTYAIEVKGIWTAFDIGKAIDDRIIQGQIEGGILQGLGYGTLEVMECKQGKIQQRTVTDYIIPTSMDFAKIESQLIDNLYARGPFGAKGAGELFLIGAAPALAAAVSNALGVPIQRLPVTPEYLMGVIENEKTH